MARPLVLVYQDLAQPQSVPQTPDLNSVIVGPCYVIRDYPDDAASILLGSAYGQLEGPAANTNQYVPPTASEDAVTVVSYPGNVAGALVDRTSIRLYLKLPRVILGSTYAIAGVSSLGTGATVFSSVGNENKVTFVGGVDLTQLGVRAGDRIILTSSNPSPEQTYIGTISSVGEPNTSGVLTDTSSLRMTANLPPNGVGAGQFAVGGAGSVEVRIERTLATQEFVDANGTVLTFPEASSDKLVIKGGITLPVTIEGADVDCVLSYAQVYLAYRALRQDLTTPDSVTNDSLLLDANGRAYFALNGTAALVDARNPLAVGLWLALQNAGSAPIYFFGTQQNDIAGHLAARATMDTRRDLYAFAPLTDDINVLGGYKTEWVNLADPAQADETGVPQKFRIVVGSIPLPTAEDVTEESITGVAQAPTGSSSDLRRTLTFAGAVSPDLTSILPGDLLTIGLAPTTGKWFTRRGTHPVGHVNSSTELEVIPSNARWDDTNIEAASGVEVEIRSPTGALKFSQLASLTMPVNSSQGVLFSMRRPTTVGGPYRVQYTNVGGSTVTIAISGFDITIGINPTVTTTQNIVDAVNAHAVLSSIVTASLVGASIAVPATVPPTSINMFSVTESFADGGATIVVRLRNPGATASPTILFDNSGGLGVVVSVATTDDITVTYKNTVSTLQQIVDAINAHTTARTLVDASLTGVSAVATLTATATAINDMDHTNFNLAISANDDLFLWLYDAAATFLTDEARVGDILEIPIDPNNYGPDAFNGRLFSFPIAQVISENRIALANNGDDTGSAVNELPHYYLRDFTNRLLDNETTSTASAIRYRVRRALSKDDQVTAVITAASSLRSKRATVCWPDQVDVADLKDGSLPRTTPTVRAAAGSLPGWAIACQVVGALAGLPVQQGLTNLGLVGVKKLYHSSGYFREAQLTQLSNGGVFVMHQRVPGELPFCLHQLTTDPAALETGELSVVKNFDYVSQYLQQIIEGFLGQYNVLPETLAEIQRAVIDGTERLKSRRVARVGPPLLSGEIQKIAVSEHAADRIVLYFKGEIPKPLNGVDFHIVI